MSPDAQALRWINIGNAALDLPFFKNSIDSLRANNAPECETRLSILDGVEMPWVEPAGIIIHMTRCGSTLVANALRQIAGVVGISEAPPVDRMMALAAASSQRMAGVGCRYLAPLVSVFSNHSDRGQQKVIIKCGINAMNCLRGLRKVWPTIPCAILIRNPLEVAVSNIWSPPPWINEWFRSPQTCPFGMPPPIVMAGGVHDLCAWVLGRFCGETLGLLDPACRVLDYDSLTVDAVLSIGRWFGIATDQHGIVADAFEYDAKKPKHAHQSDVEAKKRAVTPKLRLAVDTWVGEGYAELRRRSHIVGAQGKCGS